MKKKYIKPALEVYKIEPAQLLSMSGADERDANLGEGYPD